MSKLSKGWLLGVVASLAASTWWWSQGPRDAVPSPINSIHSVDTSKLGDALRTRLAAAVADVEAAPNSAEAWARWTRLCLANGLQTPAEEGLERCRLLQPAEPRWPYYLAVHLAGYGRLEEALPLFAEALRLSPEYLPVCIKYADTLTRLGRGEEARAVLESRRALSPAEPYVLLGLGRLAFDAGNWAVAESWLQAARKSDPSFGAPVSLLATVAEKQGREAEARSLRWQAAALGRFREIRDPWQEELLKDCYDAYRLQVAASALGTQGDPALARQWLERARELQPNDPRTLRQLGRLALSRKEWAEARRWLEQAVALDPTHAPTYIDWIEVCKYQRDQAEGERVIELGLSRCPDAAGLHYEKALLLIARQRQAEALPWLERTIELEPERFAAYQTLAAQLFRAARYEDGFAILQKGLRHHPQHPALLAMVLRFHIEAGQRDEADRVGQEALHAGVPEEALKDLSSLYRRRFGAASPFTP